MRYQLGYSSYNTAGNKSGDFIYIFTQKIFKPNVLKRLPGYAFSSNVCKGDCGGAWIWFPG